MKHVVKIQFLTGFLALSLMFGCATSFLSGNEVAKINGEVISKAEFQKNYEQVLKMMNLDPKTVKNEQYESMVTAFKKITLQNLVLSALVRQEASNLNLSVNDKELEDAYTLQANQMGGEKALEDQLKMMDFSKNDFKKELKEQLLKDKLISTIFKNKLTVTEDEAKAYYEANPQQFDQPEQIHARHILVSADRQQIEKQLTSSKKGLNGKKFPDEIESVMQEKKSKADKLLAEVQANPGKFEALARKNSDDQGSAKQGGDLGYFSRELMVPSFSEAAFKTKPGHIHENIVETPFGYHIIQVVDRRAPQKKQFEEIKTQLTDFLKSQRKNQLMETWLEDQKKKAKIVIAPEYDFDKKSDNTGEQPKASSKN